MFSLKIGLRDIYHHILQGITKKQRNKEKSSLSSFSYDIFLSTQCVYRQFRICITNTSGKAHPPMVACILRLPPGGSWRRRRLRENALHEGFHKSKVAQAPSTANAVPLPLRGRLFVSLIITQIGRENNISAESCKHPYENTPKRAFFFI